MLGEDRFQSLVFAHPHLHLNAISSNGKKGSGRQLFSNRTPTPKPNLTYIPVPLVRTHHPLFIRTRFAHRTITEGAYFGYRIYSPRRGMFLATHVRSLHLAKFISYYYFRITKT
jgi:hypothetical protein